MGLRMEVHSWVEAGGVSWSVERSASRLARCWVPYHDRVVTIVSSG